MSPCYVPAAESIKMGDRRRHRLWRPRVRPRDDDSQGLLLPSTNAAAEEEESCSRHLLKARRRSRVRSAAGSALFALLGAAAVLSGDGDDIRPLLSGGGGFQAERLLSRLLVASRRRLDLHAAGGPPPPPPVSGVRTATFFVPVEPYLKNNNKMNSRRSLPQYAAGLAETCQFLSRLDHPSHLLGDQPFARDHAASCRELISDESGSHALEDLRHHEAAAMVQRHMCRRKFATDKHDPRRILKEHVLLYLNKLDVLCALASEHPTDLTVLVDSDLDPELWLTVLSLIDRRSKDPADATLTVYEHPDYGYRSWFGRSSCRTRPTADTEFMAVRGRDCPAILDAYGAVLEGLVETARGVNLLPDAGPCPCFDDEMVLHYLRGDRPDLVSFFGTPRAVAADDDGELFDEEAADEVDLGAAFAERALLARNKEGGGRGGDEDEDGMEDEDEDEDEDEAWELDADGAMEQKEEE